MDEKDIIELQDSFFENAKQTLLSNGRVPPVCLIVTSNSTRDGVLEGGVFGLEAADLKDTFAPKDGDGYSVLVVNMDPPDQETFERICVLLPEHKEALTHSLDIGKSVFGLNDAAVYHHTVNGVLEAIRSDRKQIAIATVKKLCQKSKAFAVINIAEAYSLAMDRAQSRDSYPRTISDSPESYEVLMSSMETYNLTRMVTTRITREAALSGAPRDSGAITALEEEVVQMTKNGSDAVFKGRFLDLLYPVD